VITVTGLSKGFRHGSQVRPVLRDVSLTIERGEFVCLVGAMGSGKSTLLGLMAGLISPDAGSVHLDDAPVRGVPERAAFVFQNYSLLPWFSALENVRLAVAAAAPGLSRADQRAKAVRALELVGLGNALGRRPSQLSGGMRQRVAIARAFATDPEILFLDEPFGALDALTREALQGELARLCRLNGHAVTTVMVTNNIEEAILLADRIVPVLSGPPATLGTPIPVPLPHPRTVAQLAHDDQASLFRAHVFATLASAVGRRRTPGNAAGLVTAPALVEVKE
jgi:nitrate/nitrite transport system ATP-binding protein